MSKLSWSEIRAKRIGEEIKQLRGPRTGQWLADATKALGHPVSRTTISELENGKRKDITLAEITVIAAALGISPTQLAFPDLAHGPVDVLPDVTVNSAEAVLWFSGERGLSNGKAPFDLLATGPMRWTRTLYQQVGKLRSAINALRVLGGDALSGPRAAVIAQMDAETRTLKEHLENMERAGLNVDGDDVRAILAVAAGHGDD